MDASNLHFGTSIASREFYVCNFSLGDSPGFLVNPTIGVVNQTFQELSFPEASFNEAVLDRMEAAQDSRDQSMILTARSIESKVGTLLQNCLKESFSEEKHMPRHSTLIDALLKHDFEVAGIEASFTRSPKTITFTPILHLNYGEDEKIKKHHRMTWGMVLETLLSPPQERPLSPKLKNPAASPTSPRFSGRKWSPRKRASTNSPGFSHRKGTLLSDTTREADLSTSPSSPRFSILNWSPRKSSLPGSPRSDESPRDNPPHIRSALEFTVINAIVEKILKQINTVLTEAWSDVKEKAKAEREKREEENRKAAARSQAYYGNGNGYTERESVIL